MPPTEIDDTAAAVIARADILMVDGNDLAAAVLRITALFVHLKHINKY